MQAIEVSQPSRFCNRALGGAADIESVRAKPVSQFKNVEGIVVVLDSDVRPVRFNTPAIHARKNMRATSRRVKVNDCDFRAKRR